MFESYFFDKRATINYRVFRVMKALEKTNFTINKLSQETGLSYSQTYNAFQDIMKDLQAIQAAPENADEELNEVVFQEIGAAVSVDQYRFHLLDQSMGFRFFEYLFKTPAPEVHQFCRDNDLSISTLRRRVDPFKQYIMKHGMHLNSSTWALEGPEMQIRMLILTFFMLAYRGNGWPFSEQAYRDNTAMFDEINGSDTAHWFAPRTSITKQDLLVLAIQNMRIAQGNVLTPNDKLALLFLDDEVRPLPLIFTNEHFPNLSSPQLTAECEFYYFTRCHYLVFGGERTEADKWLTGHFANAAGPIGAFADGMLQSLTRHAQVTSRKPRSRPMKICGSTFTAWHLAIIC